MNGGNRLTFKQYLIIALSSVALFVALFNFSSVLSFVASLFSYITPLFAGACVAFVLNVPMRGFERFFAFIQRKLHFKARHTLNTYISLLLTVGVIVGVISVFVIYMAPDIEESAVAIAGKVEESYPKIKAFLKSNGIELQGIEAFFTDFNVRKVLSLLSGYGTGSTQEVLNTVLNAAGTTLSFVIATFSCIVFSIYMITGKKKLSIQARKLVYAYTPKKFADKFFHVGSLFYKTFTSFISSQCLDALLLALILFGAMTLFKLPYAGMICVITGLFALIPYVGAFASCIIGTLLVLLVSPVKALIFFAVFLVVQQLEGQFIYPHLVGGSVGLPAIWTLFAALVGGEMLGLFGILFFIPLTAVIYTLIKDGAAKRLEKKGLVVESPLDSQEREKRRIQEEKRSQRKKEKHNRKLERRRRKSYYSDSEEEDD